MKTRTGKALIVSVYTVALYYFMYNLFIYYIQGHNTRNFSSTMILATAGVFTIPFILYPFSFTSKPSGGGAGTKWEGALWVILFVVLALTLNVLLLKIPALSNSSDYIQSYQDITSGGLGQTVVASCIVAPVLEELVFRGVVFCQMKDAFGAIVGVVLSALCFGAVHHNLAQFVYAAIMGVVLALMYNRMKRIYFPMLAHALANFAVLLITNFL